MEREIFLAGGRGSLDVVPGVAYWCSGLEGPFDDLGRESDDCRREESLLVDRRVRATWTLTRVDETFVVDPQRQIPRVQDTIPNILHHLDTQRR